MVERLPIPLAQLACVAWMGLTTMVSSGCSSCSDGRDHVASPGAAGPAVKAKATPEPRAIQVHDLDLSPNAVILRSDRKVWMWVDGRSSAISHRVDNVEWSPHGFEIAVSNGFTKVLAPGGSYYYRVSIGEKRDTRPAKALFDGPTAPPPGYSIEYVDGAGGKRVQAFLVGPEGRRVRLGLFLKVPDDQVWLTGTLPTAGTASPPIDPRITFDRTTDGALVNAVPEGAEALALAPIPDAQLKTYVAATQPFTSGDNTLTAGVHAAADLDRDGEIESVLCVNGPVRMLDPRCVLIDTVDGETRMYAVGLPWVPEGNPPIAFTVDGAPYMMMVSPKEPKLGYVLRYYGAGWMAEPIR